MGKIVFIILHCQNKTELSLIKECVIKRLSLLSFMFLNWFYSLDWII